MATTEVVYFILSIYSANDPPETTSDGMYEESGEGLTIVDATGDAWVFHILPDDTQLSAVWAAQRVPDDHIAVVANKFIIRNVDFDDHVNFKYSANIRDVAKRTGLWKPSSDSDPFDFTSIFATDGDDVPSWADRRTWYKNLFFFAYFQAFVYYGFLQSFLHSWR
jgi:dipeptidase